MKYKDFLKQELENDLEFKNEYDKLENKYKRIKKKVNANRTRPKQIVIRATEKEFETMKSKVALSKLKQNDYLLKTILNKKIIVVEGLPEMTMELKRIGNNLNQLTKEVHQGKANCNKELAEIEKELSEVWQLLRLLTQKQV